MAFCDFPSRRWFAGGACCSLTAFFLIATCLSVIAPATAAEPSQSARTSINFNIPPQPLTDALRVFAKQSGLQLAYTTASLRAVATGGVQGNFTPEQALRKLLAGTSVTYRFTGTSTVTLERSVARSDDGPMRLQTITVRGELIERGVQDSQTSAVIVSGDTLERRGGEDLRALAERTAGVSTSFGTSAFSIRGIPQDGVGGAGSGPTINVNIDGAQVAGNFRLRSTLFSTWDLDQIEILRGPQSTQTGRNALAGAVVIRSNDPSYDYEFKGQGGFGSLDTGEGAVAINVPIFEDKMAVRLAVDKETTDGATDNPTLGIDDYDGEDRSTIRMGLRLDPSEDLSAVLKFTRFSALRSFGQIDAAAFPDARRTFDNVQDEEDVLLRSVNLRLSYDVNDAVRLESESNFAKSEVSQIIDADGGAAAGGVNFASGESRSIEQEIKVRYEMDSVDAVAGVYFLDSTNENDISAGIIRFNQAQDTRNYALFGEVEYAILPGLRLIAGGRYDSEDFDDDTFTSFLPTQVQVSDTSFSAFLPKAGVVYDFTEDLSLGFTYQRGYRAGGSVVNAFTGIAGAFDPEFTDNVELALRSQWLDRRLTVNANAFYTKWKDQQLRVNGPSGNPLDFNVENAGESRLLGGELEIEAVPMAGLTVFGSIAYTDTKFKDFNSNGVQLAGNEFPFAPQLTAAFGGEYVFENGMFLGSDVSYTDSAFSEVNNIDSRRTDSRFLVNIQAGYEGEHWRALLYGTNIFDRDYVTHGNSATTVEVGDPARYGIMVSFEF